MGSKLVLWQKAGRFFTAIVVLCFFLPFFGISCNGMEVVKVSGADMVGGCKPGGMINELDDKMGELGGSTYGGGMPGVDREPFAIAAMALALAGFGLAWSRRRQALLAGAVVAVLGIASLAGLWVVMNDKLSDTSELSKKAGGGGGGDMDFGGEMAKDVKVDSGARMGFWLTLLGFAGIAALTIAALREKEGAVSPHSTGYPPAPPPQYPPPGGGGYPPPGGGGGYPPPGGGGGYPPPGGGGYPPPGGGGGYPPPGGGGGYPPPGGGYPPPGAPPAG